MADKHVIMKHSLAKALMDAGMHHYDLGGIISGISGALTPTNQFHADLAPTQTSNYGDTIGTATNNALGGYGTAQGIQSQQQSLAQSLLAQSRGEGPNPAQAALNNATGQNVAGQAALMASARGANANPGLIARQAAMQGGAIQQNAVGQAAALQAQQQIAAQGALAQQQAIMGQQNIAEQGVNAGILGTAAGAQNAQNNTSVANYGMQQGLNQQTAAQNAAAQQKTMGGIYSGLAGAAAGPLGSMMMGSGGGGGSTNAPGSAPSLGSYNFGSAGPAPFAKGGMIPDHLQKVASIYHPEYASGASNFQSGGPVPGKASVKGDSSKNDTVPALVSPGEVVLPRSVTQAKNAPDKAAEFMRHLQKKDGKEGGKKGYEKVAASKRGVDLEDRVQRLEKFFGGGMVQ